jgi:hypothetical protein
MVLCLQCSGQYENRPEDEIALALRVTRDEWIESRNELVLRSLLDEKTLKIKAWDKRQYISDIKDPTAAERQKRYRDNKRNARNDTVTLRPPEQNRTEQIQNKDTVSQKSIKKKETSTPEKFEVTPEMFAWAVEQGLSEIRIKPETENFLDRNRSKDTKYTDWIAAWRTWMRNAVKFTRTA